MDARQVELASVPGGQAGAEDFNISSSDAIESLLGNKSIGRVIVSTDSEDG